MLAIPLSVEKLYAQNRIENWILRWVANQTEMIAHIAEIVFVDYTP